MNIQLILGKQTTQSQATQNIWQSTCDDMALSLQVASTENEDGQLLVETLALRTLPALVVDSRVIAVGHPDKISATKILQSLKEKN